MARFVVKPSRMNDSEIGASLRSELFRDNDRRRSEKIRREAQREYRDRVDRVRSKPSFAVQLGKVVSLFLTLIALVALADALVLSSTEGKTNLRNMIRNWRGGLQGEEKLIWTAGEVKIWSRHFCSPTFRALDDSSPSILLPPPQEWDPSKAQDLLISERVGCAEDTPTANSQFFAHWGDSNWAVWVSPVRFRADPDNPEDWKLVWVDIRGMGMDPEAVRSVSTNVEGLDAVGMTLDQIAQKATGKSTEAFDPTPTASFTTPSSQPITSMDNSPGPSQEEQSLDQTVEQETPIPEPVLPTNTLVPDPPTNTPTPPIPPTPTVFADLFPTADLAQQSQFIGRLGESEPTNPEDKQACQALEWQYDLTPRDQIPQEDMESLIRCRSYGHP